MLLAVAGVVRSLTDAWFVPYTYQYLAKFFGQLYENPRYRRIADESQDD